MIVSVERPEVDDLCPMCVYQAQALSLLEMYRVSLASGYDTLLGLRICSSHVVFMAMWSDIKMLYAQGS